MAYRLTAPQRAEVAAGNAAVVREVSQLERQDAYETATARAASVLNRTLDQAETLPESEFAAARDAAWLAFRTATAPILAALDTDAAYPLTLTGGR